MTALNYALGFYFFTTQVPYYIWGKKWQVPGVYEESYISNLTNTQWVFLTLGNSMPSLVLNIDAIINSVQYYSKHLIIIMVIAVLFLCEHLILFYYGGPNRKPDYPTEDWFNNPVLASIIAITVFIFLPL